VCGSGWLEKPLRDFAPEVLVAVHLLRSLHRALYPFGGWIGVCARLRIGGSSVKMPESPRDAGSSPVGLIADGSSWFNIKIAPPKSTHMTHAHVRGQNHR